MRWMLTRFRVESVPGRRVTARVLVTLAEGLERFGPVGAEGEGRCCGEAAALVGWCAKLRGGEEALWMEFRARAAEYEVRRGVFECYEVSHFVSTKAPADVVALAIDGVGEFLLGVVVVEI